MTIVVEATELDWQADALCREVDAGETFFPERGEPNVDAKRICAGCEVRAECLAFALAQDIRFGIWGGMSERERTRLRRAENARNRGWAA